VTDSLDGGKVGCADGPHVSIRVTV